MKKLLTIAILVSTMAASIAQPIRTLVHKDSTKIKSFKGYGEMFIKGSKLRNELYAVIGGRAGFMFNRKIAFGGVGAGYISPNYFKGDNLAGNTAADLNLKMGSGGVFSEYIYKLEKPVHFSIPVNFIIGNVTITDTKGANLESATVYMIEPGFNLEFNFSRILIVSLNISYRISKMDSLVNLNSQSMSGIVFGLTGKFGSF